MTRSRAAVAAALMMAALAAGAGAGCKKQGEEAPAEGAQRPPAISEAELKRGHDACAAYVAKVCECAKAVPAAQRPCELSKALPESIEVALQVSAHPDTERMDVVQSADVIRKTIARCIEQTAKLPELGCP